MVYDGAVKDQESSAGPAASAAVSEASSAAPSGAVVRASPVRPSHDKRLGVRHPLKHRRFRAGGKMMVEPGGMPSAHAVVEGEEGEEEASEVEEDEEETTSAETEVLSSPAPPVVEEMEVEGGEMELLRDAAVAVGESELEARIDEEDEVLSPAAVAVGELELEARKDEEDEVLSPAASVPPLEAPKEEEREEKEKEREKQKERERVDEVGYMSGGWKR